MFLAGADLGGSNLLVTILIILAIVALIVFLARGTFRR